MEIITKSAAETYQLGRKMGLSLKGGEVLALSGDLGSGKTTFIQGLASAFGIKKIISPTFILMRTYPSTTLRANGPLMFYHLDLYRLEGNVDGQLRDLGVEELWSDPQNIVVIEWADKAGNLPQNTKWVSFKHTGEDNRKIEL